MSWDAGVGRGGVLLPSLEGRGRGWVDARDTAPGKQAESVRPDNTHPQPLPSREGSEEGLPGAAVKLRFEVRGSAGEDFSTFVWGMAGGAPIRGDGEHVPAKTPLSEEMSKALKARGFKFVGPVIVYAWLQACGVVDDHVEGCWRR